MCQGVIVSYVYFKPYGKKRTKRIRLEGIGSHSQLLADNQVRLREEGWAANGNDRVISYESDLKNGWGVFKKEIIFGGVRDLADLETFFRQACGNAQKLIAYVRKHRKFDRSLVEYLTPEAQVKFCERAERARTNREMHRSLFSASDKRSAREGEHIEIWAKLFDHASNRIPILRKRMGRRQYPLAKTR